MPQLLWQTLVLLWVLSRFALLSRGRHRQSFMHGFARTKELVVARREWVSPLRQERGVLHAVDPEYLRKCAVADATAEHVLPSALHNAIVLHFTGTGETRHGPLAIIRNMLSHSPELATLPHFIVDAPQEAAAYVGARAFAAELWKDIEPLVDAHDGPFLLVGLSRGALAALETGGRIASEKHKVASVLACSPPFVRPERLAPAIELIASLEKLVELSHEQLALFPSEGSRRAFLRISRPMQVMLTSLVLHELGIDDDENRTLALTDVVHDEPLAASLRSVREFAMLTRVPVSELSDFADELGHFAKHQPLLSAAIAWGRDDPWIPAERNQKLVAEAIARAGAEQGAVGLMLLPDVGHAFPRLPEHPKAQLRAATVQLIAWTAQKMQLRAAHPSASA